MSFTGKVVLITGASSGIGAATALRFAELGASLSLCGRNEEKLKSVASQCTAFFNLAPLTIIADLTVEKEITKIIDKTITFFLTIDILVNNAGVLEYGTIDNVNLRSFDKIFNINVRAMYHLTALAMPYLVQAGGNIVNVSSLGSMRSFPNQIIYNMSKAAVDQLTNNVALELLTRHVRVNSVNPGLINTPLLKRAGMTDKQVDDIVRRSNSSYTNEKMGNPKDVANAITFLASGEASFINGVNLIVDGGRHLICPH